HHMGQQPVLVCEVRKKRSLCNTRLPGDGIHRNRIERLSVRQLSGRFKNACFRLVGSLLRFPGHTDNLTAVIFLLKGNSGLCKEMTTVIIKCSFMKNQTNQETGKRIVILNGNPAEQSLSR